MATPLPPPGTGGTTLVEELRCEATNRELLATMMTRAGDEDAALLHHAFAVRLRARAAHASKMERSAAETVAIATRPSVRARVIDELCGPLSPTEPAATPTEKGRTR